MRCADCLDALTPFIDDELMPAESRDVREHLAACAECERERRLITDTSQLLREKLVRYSAPDVLKARIRSALAQPNAFDPPVAVRAARAPWTRLVAAGVTIAVASSVLTFAAANRASSSRAAANDVLASHIRSLMPGHLTDVVSTNQHNVKPWFNGRLGLSPTVPSLDSAGFVLVGGRLDYLDGHPTAVVVYARRQHFINVYSWPTANGSPQTVNETSDRGYHLMHWRNDGIEYWAASDLNSVELGQFVRDFTAAR